MSIITAAKLATAQRKLVKKVATYKGNEFKYNSETYRSMPDAFKRTADEIAKLSGEYSKNPIKNIQSWIKRFSAIRNSEKEVNAILKNIK